MQLSAGRKRSSSCSVELEQEQENHGHRPRGCSFLSDGLQSESRAWLDAHGMLGLALGQPLGPLPASFW